MLDRIRPDRILSGVHRGAMSGVELCAHLGTHLEFQLIPFMLPTSASELDARVAGLTA